MIYMRERQNNRKRQEGREEPARNYIDQLKSKFAKKNAPKQLEVKQENVRKENDLKSNPINLKPPAQKYAISKSKGNESSHSQSKFSQSIIVHDLPENANLRFSKKPALASVRCFDIQIVNDLSSSRYRAQAYIQMLQREKELKNRQILNLKELLSTTKEREHLSYKQQIEQLKQVISEQAMNLQKYVKYFNEGKQLFLSVVMELMESRNQLKQRLTEQRIRIKEKSLNRCIQRIERVISIYSSFIEFNLKRSPQEIITLDQLWNNVKYQEKIIELMKENENNLKIKNYHHENTLLRYQISRLSKHNQQLLKFISNQEDSIEQDYSQIYPNHPPTPHQRPQESIIVNEEEDSHQIEDHSQEDSSISEDKQQTPFQKLKPQFSHSIQHPFSNLEAEGLQQANNKLEKELSECKNRIGVLQVQKQYVLDQLQQIQKSQKQLKNELKAILTENEQLSEEVRELKVIHPLKQDNYDIAKEQEKVLEEQNELLKEKLKFLFKPNGKETVTVEQLLKLLKRKELANYHQALMELISKYEQRISQLTNSYLYQRELKQHSLTYCKGLFNLVQAKSNSEEHASLEQIIDYINKYQQIMAELKENEIDVYLRKIKSFSIGIDENSVEIIKEQLKDYVYQLQTRLPTLSEEYLQDGSSIADSYHNSVDKFD